MNHSRARKYVKRVLPASVTRRISEALNPNNNSHHPQPKFPDVRALPSMQHGSTSLFGKEFEFVDGFSFLFLYDEIIEREIYKFSTDEPAPYIIDGGSNIGLSVLYFKRAYPKARILAFEPDPNIFEVLKRNCRRFELEEVELFDRALWMENGSLGFREDGSLGGRLADDGNSASDAEVPTTRLRDLLNAKVTLLKLDIEGAETDVLEDCADRLVHVENMFVEYHSFADRPQSLHRLLKVVHEAGFRTHFHVFEPSAQPLFERTIREGIDRLDMNLDIFCFRD
ncbi:MAG: FkbM family methyltransferase [Pyrinomonadaceae bacterium]